MKNKSKIRRKLPGRVGRKPGQGNLPDRVNYLIWTDFMDQVPAEQTAGKLGVSKQAILDRRNNLKAFIDPDGTKLNEWRGGVNILVSESLDVVKHELTNKKNLDLALKILTSIGVIKDSASTVPTAGGITQLFFGANGMSDAERSDLRNGLLKSFGSTSRF